MSALNEQVGGDHYKFMPIQPMTYSMKNGLNACQHTVIKYVTRYRGKDTPYQNLQKAKHTIDLLMELEGITEENPYGNASRAPEPRFNETEAFDVEFGKRMLDANYLREDEKVSSIFLAEGEPVVNKNIDPSKVQVTEERQYYVNRLPNGLWTATSVKRPYFYFIGVDESDVIVQAERAIKFYNEKKPEFVLKGEPDAV